jgi:hypothetical protein
MPKLYWLDERNLLFHCPGCQKTHYVRIAGPGPSWEWNGDMDVPTFNPSLIYNSQSMDSESANRRCHSYIREGSIEFLSDSQHGMARQHVPLPDWVGNELVTA